MDVLTVGVVAGAVAAVIGFFFGRRTGRTSGGSIGGAPARSSPSGETTGADAAFRLSLSRIGAYLRGKKHFLHQHKNQTKRFILKPEGKTKLKGEKAIQQFHTLRKHHSFFYTS